MQDLKADTDILIVRADKANANVVMNRSEYEKQLEEMLMDSNTYAKITDRRRNPTTKTERDLETMLKIWFDLGHLTEADYWRLRSFDSIAASFYGVPKVHKVSLVEKKDHFTVEEGVPPVKIPLRPIYSCIGSPTYQVSKYFAYLLKWLFQSDEYSVKNGKEFSDFVYVLKGLIRTKQLSLLTLYPSLRQYQ